MAHRRRRGGDDRKLARRAIDESGMAQGDGRGSAEEAGAARHGLEGSIGLDCVEYPYPRPDSDLRQARRCNWLGIRYREAAPGLGIFPDIVGGIQILKTVFRVEGDRL